jgi:nucleoside-diphosphate-sugar epimerase
VGRQAGRRGTAPGDSFLKIAVTGASGFIGRHVVGELERRGLSATLAGRSSPSTRSTHRHVKLDLRALPADVFRVLGEPDTVIHLAWSGLPNYKSAHHVNDELPAQYAFLERVVNGGLKNLLVAGTCLEYGMQSGALREDQSTAPVTQYGIAKDSLRTRLQDLQRSSPFSLTWARLFYSYGEGQAPTSILPQLRAAVARGDQTFNMSGGEQVRDYLPVTTIAEYLVSLATNGRSNGIVNVCSGRPVTLREQVEEWIEANNWLIELNLGHYPYLDYEPMEFWGDRAKLDRVL